MVAQQRFGRTRVFTLRDLPTSPTPTSGSRLIPTTAIHARASHSSDRLALLFDGDRDTRWLTGGHQSGGEWIELELDRPRNIGLVRMQTGERSFGDYPRDLAIDVVEDGRVRTLFHGSVLPAFGSGFAIDNSYPWVDVPLPDNRAHIIRLRQLGITHQLFWSIHELELLER